jgi:CRP-like cAMP-binding protein
MRIFQKDAVNGSSRQPPLASAQGRAENALLAGLSPAALAEIQKHVHHRSFQEGAAIWHAGETINQIYFPCSGMISIRVPTKYGDGIEVATVGREAAAGLQDSPDPSSAITRAITQVAGEFACITKEHFVVAARQHEELRSLRRCCIDWLLLQAQQIAACNSVHTADARFCRWLLRMSDLLAHETVPATQEAIAEALGLRRTTATLIARRLQSVGMISYRRGRIEIIDRAALKAASCDCCAALGLRNWPSELLRAKASAATEVASLPTDWSPEQGA